MEPRGGGGGWGGDGERRPQHVDSISRAILGREETTTCWFNFSGYFSLLLIWPVLLFYTSDSVKQAVSQKNEERRWPNVSICSTKANSSYCCLPLHDRCAAHHAICVFMYLDVHPMHNLVIHSRDGMHRNNRTIKDTSSNKGSCVICPRQIFTLLVK